MIKRFRKVNKGRYPLNGLNVQQILRINGKTIGRKNYKIGWRSEGWAGTPRELAYYLFRNKRLIDGWDHIRWDIFNALVKELPDAKKKDIESAWMEFFVNDKAFIEKLFEERNNRQSEYTKVGDQLKIETEGIIKHFEHLPLPVKYSFVYYLAKVAYQSDYKEMEKEVNENIPPEAKEWVDNSIVTNKEE